MLINKNVIGLNLRTSVRLEPTFWESLREIAIREEKGVSDVIQDIERWAATRFGKLEPTSRTEAIRTYVLNYFRSAATEQGHALQGHGVMAHDESEATATRKAPVRAHV